MPQLNFPESEEDVLKKWKEQDIFAKVSAKESPAGTFVFFEGPPTANAKPGLHHILTRVFKDIILRFKTMQGFHIDRKAGWDTHGLPVELQVEKKLGISGKPQIENIVAGDPRASIIAFNAECKKMVWEFVVEWQNLTERIGYWLDTSNPYITYANEYIESVWWVFKQVWDRGLVYQGHKVVPYCTRCGTALSTHEVAQGYKTVKDTSVYVKFALIDAPNTFLLSWTTTPWTLPGNCGLAVGEDIIYVQAAVGEEHWILSSHATHILPEGYTIEKEFSGKELVGKSYEPLFDVAGMRNEAAFKVYAAPFVTDTDGVGVVHIAPMYGEDDYSLGEAVALTKMHTVDEEGNFVEAVSGDLAGMHAKDPMTEKKIIEHLKARNAFVAETKFEHEYPFCWRCSTPLLYYARDSWFIRMQELREELLKRNATIHWEPDYIKEGRFGDWLANARDWAISRERYWGTPMPVWVCATCKEAVAVGSLAELGVTEDMDLHRPYVDDLTMPCSKCGSEMHRVKEVLDVWFDSGAMPIAQWGFPAVAGSDSALASHYPADYICEAIDQTRGWFYTLLAIATLLEKEAPYKNVICLGHLLDAKGEKMSKSKGNIVVPDEVIAEHGVDAVRWYMFTAGAAGEPKRFDLKGLEQAKRRTLMMFWNVVEFYSLYSHLAEPDTKERPTILDRWIRSRLNQTSHEVTTCFESYDVTRAGRSLAEFIDDLSTWYVRRSRDRFKEGSVIAAVTLRDVLYCVTALMAPFTPFLAETVYKKMGGELSSIHLASWPPHAAIDETLLKQMTQLRGIVEMGLALRAEAKLKVRQPLAAVSVAGVKFASDLKEIIADELNVKEVADASGAGWVTKQEGSVTVALDTALTSALREEGLMREIVRTVNGMRKDAGLSLSDQIIVTFDASPELGALIEAHHDELKKSTLAEEYRAGTVQNGTELISDLGVLTLDITTK